MAPKTDKRARHVKEEPRVGIFWVVNGKPLIDSTPLSQAEPYGDYLTHPRSHYEVWSQFQRGSAVSIDVEYEEEPRGRVMYDGKARQFQMLADRCILKNKALVEQIKKELHIPKSVLLGTDSHYRCFRCLPRDGD
jgi:hypothetical protein